MIIPELLVHPTKKVPQAQKAKFHIKSQTIVSILITSEKRFINFFTLSISHSFPHSMNQILPSHPTIPSFRLVRPLLQTVTEAIQATHLRLYLPFTLFFPNSLIHTQEQLIFPHSRQDPLPIFIYVFIGLDYVKSVIPVILHFIVLTTPLLRISLYISLKILL